MMEYSSSIYRLYVILPNKIKVGVIDADIQTGKYLG